MARGIALLTGVKDVSTGGLGCERDVDKMLKVISSADKYEFILLKTEQATASAILPYIECAARTLISGDMFVFYFSGHGGQKPDINGDETDGQDETLCTFASEITDDELAVRWLKFAPGVRIVMLSDCCHSGTNQNLAPRRTMQKARKPIGFVGSLPKPEMKAQLIHFGACRDDQNTAAGPAGGAFTLMLFKIWDKGRFQGTYRQFHEAIKAGLQKEGFLQEPQFNFYGDVQPAFLDSKPFSLS